jgi:hypothetical protein
MFQLGIDGGVFSLFNLDTHSNDLINSDYILGLSLNYRRDDFSGRFRLYHNSSHLGDEYVLNNPGVERDNPSYEDTELVASYEIAGFRPYVGFGGIVRSADSVKRLHFQGGLEYHRMLVGEFLGFVAAADLQTLQRQKWALNQSYFVGVGLYGKSDRHVRIGAEFVRGHSFEGQFVEQKLYYWGAALYFSP